MKSIGIIDATGQEAPPGPASWISAFFYPRAAGRSATRPRPFFSVNTALFDVSRRPGWRLVSHGLLAVTGSDAWFIPASRTRH